MTYKKTQSKNNNKKVNYSKSALGSPRDEASQLAMKLVPGESNLRYIPFRLLLIFKNFLISITSSIGINFSSVLIR